MFQLLLRIRKIISIDISGLEAGTQYSGSFEENVQNLVNEVKEAGDIILFFDEIHKFLVLVARVMVKGLKVLLISWNQLFHVENWRWLAQLLKMNTVILSWKNAALARRFNRSQGKCSFSRGYFKILQEVIDLYQQHHNVILPDEVLKATVDYSVQYIPCVNLPDKAIDLVDVTAAHLAAQHPVTDVHAVERESEAQKDKQKKQLRQKILKQL